MLKHYYKQDQGRIFFSREQGSRFAKSVAGDYNPLHDINAKKFCVPGDLLFAVVLEKYGISEHMEFSFMGMVTEHTRLICPEQENLEDSNNTLLLSDGDKDYLSVKRRGAITANLSTIHKLIDQYVAFSGTTFPHVIVPLMAQENVMINPSRPMVMYQAMSIHLNTIEMNNPTLEFTAPIFEMDGKRGNIILPFNIMDNETLVGQGEKRMLVSGIKPYDKEQVDSLITEYNNWK